MIKIKNWGLQHKYFLNSNDSILKKFEQSKIFKVCPPKHYYGTIKGAKIIKDDKNYYIQFETLTGWEKHYHIYSNDQFKKDVMGYYKWEINYANG